MCKKRTESVRVKEGFVLDAEFQKHFEQNKVAVVATDKMGQITLANELFCELTGYSLEQLKCFCYQDITPERWTVFENSKVTREVFNSGYAKYQKEYIDANGSTYPIELEVYLLREDDGTPTGMWAKVTKLEKLQVNVDDVLL